MNSFPNKVEGRVSDLLEILAEPGPAGGFQLTGRRPNGFLLLAVEVTIDLVQGGGRDGTGRDTGDDDGRGPIGGEVGVDGAGTKVSAWRAGGEADGVLPPGAISLVWLAYHEYRLYPISEFAAL